MKDGVCFMAKIEQVKEHPAHIDLPQSQEQFEALVQDIKERGMVSRLVCVASGEDYHVLCGNQRLKAAIRLGWDEVPVEVVKSIDPVSMMLADNIVGRTRTKSAIAVQVFLYHKDTLLKAGAPEDRKTKGLLKDHPSKKSPFGQNPNGETLGISAISLSEKYGFDEHLLGDLEEIWRGCDGCETEKGKGIWEDVVRAILVDEVSIPRCRAGFGGKVATLGKKRKETDFGGLAIKASVSLGTAWRNWERMDPAGQEVCIERFCESLEAIPDAGIEAIGVACAKWSDARTENLMRSMAERLGWSIKKRNA